MRKYILLFTLVPFFTLQLNAQKVFTMGTNKMKLEVAANQAELMYTKDKKTYLICPENPVSGSKRGKRCLMIFDNKGKKEAVKNIVIDNDAKKLHDIEKVMFINSKVFCIHSFYDKTEKKYSLYQTTLAETDGQPESLGREVLSLETKNPEVIQGIDVVFSNDSSKIMVMVYENASSSKNLKLNLHCLVFNKEDFSFDRDNIFNIEMASKGLIRAKATISNQSTIYVMAESRVKKSNTWSQTLSLYYRDNEDAQQSVEFGKGDMKNISIFDLRFDRKENLVLAGMFSNKANLDFISGGFVYIFDVAKNEFKETTVFDNDDDLSGLIRKVQDPSNAKDLIRPAKFNLYIDQANNYFLVGQQYDDFKEYADELKSEVFVNPDARSLYTNIMVNCANSSGKILWHKGFTGKVLFNIWDNNRLNILSQEERELRLMSLAPDKSVKFSKGAAPTEPDHKLDTRCMLYIGDGRIGAIGHAMTGSGGFYLDYFDLTSIDVKGKPEVEKKKKK